ncbi:PREDICTED: nicastrin [Nicrophorus vespilloides]|uniref:Nicastrin n=1 Tax=Nicrophorus vespilloides TaxID=110193 RepID=A0ABM1MIQ0_NICVS|nr:PREDICTED: nicastrin [Nicrophorus vespilloides]
MRFYVNFILLVALIVNSQSNAQRTKDKMYQPLNGIASCFRRMNGTHQTGCSSAKEGTTGVVHYVKKSSELDLILSLDNNLQYIPAIPVNEFTKEVVQKLLTSSKISGLVVYETNETTIKHFSHEDSCPNRYSNLDGTCTKSWNEYGTGLLLEDLSIPIFYLNLSEDVKMIKDCFIKFNNFSYETHQDRSLCALELSSFMFAAINTPTCIRRGSNANFNFNTVKFCDALGDQNVWATLFPIAQTNSLKYVVVSARMDSSSMFSDLVPGAASPVSGLVTLLSTAQVLKRMVPKYEDYDYNVIFVLFNGESYDYIGSQRIVYDMSLDRYPVHGFTTSNNETVSNINLKDIALYIEISQISQVDQMYIHYKKDSEEITRMFNLLDKNNADRFKKSSGNIPPASLQSFLNEDPEIPGIVLADHGDTYKSQYYHSIYDNAANLQFNYVNTSENSIKVVPEDSIQEYVAKISTGLAKSIFEFVTKEQYNGSEKADVLLVNELFHCYLENANCTVHQAVQRRQFRQAPFNLYVSVAVVPNIVTSLIGLTLAWFTADKVKTGPCDPDLNTDIYRYFNMSESISNLNSTQCFKASMNFTEAKSPAFDIEDYAWDSGKYSTWSESVWHDFSMRMFLKPSKSHEIMTISIGTTVFVAAIAIILFIKRKSEVLFESGDTTPTNC